MAREGGAQGVALRDAFRGEVWVWDGLVDVVEIVEPLRVPYQVYRDCHGEFFGLLALIHCFYVRCDSIPRSALQLLLEIM